MSFIIEIGLVTGDVNNGNFDRTYVMGDWFAAFMCIQYGSFLLGNSMPNLQIYQAGLKAIKAVMEVIDHTPTINIEDDTLAPINSIDDIEYKNVVFQYKSRNDPAVRGININILKGKITAFVGEPGSGKTTIVKLLNRLYDPMEGEILINGQDLRSINLLQYRRLISYVSQEPSLFNESIKENLLNGNPYASDAEIEEALKVWMAYDFIQRLPQGLNTNFGEIGDILSGCQKQRIALARTVLRKPDLLILDEATSALDMKNKKNVQDAIDNVSKQFRMTTVVIAHRLNTIKNADTIYVLDKWKVVEKGNHNELIRFKKVYAHLFKSQQFALSAIQKHNIKENNKRKAELTESDDLTEEDYNLNDKFQNGKTSESNEMSTYETSSKLLFYSRPYSYIVIVFFAEL